MTDINALAERLEAVRLHLDDIHHRDEIEVLDQAAQALRGMGMLTDPAVVHINMLRGGIAKLTPAQIGHTYRGDEAVQVIAEVIRQSPAARSALKERGGLE